ncbi:mushroom body large type Kenyon cell specific [Echinococcus multilocularis]|uniref:Mushroom body large type Kenyon cell specific n=1 Tax=Echinococcus multilocularis TaxID=6211 RepID=A0A068Y6X7_ECHMU|nr:mushroom body large type Kenyon cell specific [Echinococcus multilocularis]
MSKQTSGSEGVDYDSNNSEMFSNHFKRILSDYMALFRLIFETHHATNRTRLLGANQPGTGDGCIFPYFSSTKYVPVPPPALLSCYLRISGCQSQATCDQMLQNAAASMEFNQNDLSNLAGVFQLEARGLDSAVIQCAVEANGLQGCPPSRSPRTTCLRDTRTYYRSPHGLRVDKTTADMSSHSSKKSSLPQRRPYTASELASAVNAICSGRLGTRRAASMYGIPRSTLRNKICKLNEIRKHEETMRGGKPISLSEFVQQFTSSGKLSNDTSHRKDVGWYSSSVALSYRLASVFKVNCRTTPSERSDGTSLRTFFEENDVWNV